MEYPYLVSVLLPTRARPELMLQSITSIIEKARHPEKVQILLKIDNDDINYFTRYSYKKKNFYGKDWDLKFTAEQFIYFKSISKHVEKKILHAHDFSKSKLLAAENYLVNNYFLVDPDSIDFVFPKYDPKINHNLK